MPKKIGVRLGWDEGGACLPAMVALQSASPSCLEDRDRAGQVLGNSGASCCLLLLLCLLDAQDHPTALING